jgi:D-glucosaminate-6-phosphate ammonia-lyase
MGIYDRFGVRTRINAAGLLTRLGGSLMPPEVLDAMAEAASSFVDMAELQAAASAVIARHTGAEAGLVTSGAAAGLTLGTAACLAGLNAGRMDRLPETDDLPNEIIMCRTHRTGYDHAIRAAGARIREVGFNDRATGAGVRDIEIWELEAAITLRTAAVAYMATPDSRPPLDEVAAMAHRHRVPVLVDAAAQLPPVENLRRFVASGADLVAFSGGKAIRGPQGTGILCGRRELIASAALQQLDLDVRPETWRPPAPYLCREVLCGIPHHGIGRGFKASKEAIVGLLVALERFVTLDHAAERRVRERWLATIQERVAGLPCTRTRLLSVTETGRDPLLEIRLDEPALGRSAYEVSLALQDGNPPVHLGERRAPDGILTVNPVGLQEGEADIVANRLLAVLQEKGSGRRETTVAPSPQG